MPVACSQCGEMFEASDIVTIKGLPVCGTCKPFFLKKIQEGDTSVTGFVYKGFWIRFVADWFDGFLLGILFQTMNLFITIPTAESISDPLYFFSILSLSFSFLFIMTIVYYVFFNGRYGATPGKMLIGAKIVNTDGTPISYKKAFARFFAEMLSGLILNIGYIMAAFDSEKRALHDRICETLVVKK
ncbi:MAG: RDD family protein [bacterium]